MSKRGELNVERALYGAALNVNAGMTIVEAAILSELYQNVGGDKDDLSPLDQTDIYPLRLLCAVKEILSSEDSGASGTGEMFKKLAVADIDALGIGTPISSELVADWICFYAEYIGEKFKSMIESNEDTLSLYESVDQVRINYVQSMAGSNVPVYNEDYKRLIVERILRAGAVVDVTGACYELDGRDEYVPGWNQDAESNFLKYIAQMDLYGGGDPDNGQHNDDQIAGLILGAIKFGLLGPNELKHNTMMASDGKVGVSEESIASFRGVSRELDRVIDELWDSRYIFIDLAQQIYSVNGPEGVVVTEQGWEDIFRIVVDNFKTPRHMLEEVTKYFAELDAEYQDALKFAAGAVWNSIMVSCRKSGNGRLLDPVLGYG